MEKHKKECSFPARWWENRNKACRGGAAGSVPEIAFWVSKANIPQSLMPLCIWLSHKTESTYQVIIHLEKEEGKSLISLNSSICLAIHPLINSFIYPPIHKFIHSFIHSFITHRVPFLW